MQFNYSKKHLKGDLILGIVQIGIGLASLLTNSIGQFFQYGWLLIGTITLYKNFKERKTPYLILENETLLTQYLFGYKKTLISEFNEIEKKNNSLILKNDKKKKKIWTWLAEKNTPELLFAGINKIITERQKTE